MANCQYCNQEMLKVDSCTMNHVEFPDGEILDSVPYNPSDSDDPERRCHDCNVKVGGFHHPGCDMERCPKCGGQLISCGCLEEGEDD